MRDDQITRLQALSESLGEVVIHEVDPANWPGAEKDPADLTQQERGDRYWSKKNAAATMTPVSYTHLTLPTIYSV